jgi:hypothetical protein
MSHPGKAGTRAEVAREAKLPKRKRRQVWLYGQVGQVSILPK